MGSLSSVWQQGNHTPESAQGPMAQTRARLSIGLIEFEPVMGLREKQRGQRREQILDAARRLIRATGGTDFPMRRLAEESEVSLVTPYNLFGSKSGVLYALLNDSLEGLDREVDVRPSAKPVDAVLELAGIAAELYASDPAFYRPLIRFLLGVADAERRPRSLEQSLQRWTRTVEAAVSGGLLPATIDRGLLARQLLITFVGVLELWMSTRISTTTRFARRASTAPRFWFWRSRLRPRGRDCSSRLKNDRAALAAPARAGRQRGTGKTIRKRPRAA